MWTGDSTSAASRIERLVLPCDLCVLCVFACYRSFVD